MTIEQLAGDMTAEFDEHGIIPHTLIEDNLDMIFENIITWIDMLEEDVHCELLTKLEDSTSMYHDRVIQFNQEIMQDIRKETSGKQGVSKNLTTIKNGKVVPMEKGSEKISLVCMNDVDEEEIHWLYQPYVPRGKITLCAAYPGAGKTYLLCYMAACVSNGKAFFDICPFNAENEKVVYLTSEDGLGDTIKARLRICGANMENVFSVIDKNAELSFDNPQIEEIIKEVKPGLLIFDPFQSYIGEDVELNAANKTRAKLNHIVGLAEKYNVAIVLICHFNKNQKGDAITRIIGSTDIVGVSRSYIAVGAIPDDSSTKYMSHEKSSLDKRGKTILFEINPEEGGIKYLGKSDLTMDDYTKQASENRRRAAPAVEAAKEFLKNQIPGGKRPAKDIYNLAKANRISESSLKKAKKELGITSKQDGFKGPHIWCMPVHEETGDEATQPNLSCV